MDRFRKQVRASAPRVALRQQATRPVLDALLDSGALRKGRIPKGWRALCGVDRSGRPNQAGADGPR